METKIWKWRFDNKGIALRKRRQNCGDEENAKESNSQWEIQTDKWQKRNADENTASEKPWWGVGDEDMMSMGLQRNHNEEKPEINTLRRQNDDNDTMEINGRERSWDGTIEPKKWLQTAGEGNNVTRKQWKVNCDTKTMIKGRRLKMALELWRKRNGTKETTMKKPWWIDGVEEAETEFVHWNEGVEDMREVLSEVKKVWRRIEKQEKMATDTKCRTYNVK